MARPKKKTSATPKKKKKMDLGSGFIGPGGVPSKEWARKRRERLAKEKPPIPAKIDKKEAKKECERELKLIVNAAPGHRNKLRVAMNRNKKTWKCRKRLAPKGMYVAVYNRRVKKAFGKDATWKAQFVQKSFPGGRKKSVTKRKNDDGKWSVPS